MSVLLYVGGGLFLIFVRFSTIAVGIERLHEREMSGVSLYRPPRSERGGHPTEGA
jgi:hypothetical protein